MMDKWFHVCLVFVVVLFRVITADPKLQCIKQDSCSCRISDYAKIDISTVMQKHTYIEDGRNDVTYYFFGCKDFPVNNNTIKDVPVTKPMQASLFKYNKNDKTPALEAVGLAKDVTFDLALGTNYEIHYKNGSSLITVVLVCGDFDTPIIKLLDGPDTSPTLALVSSLACVIKEPHGYSTGSILVIIFIVACILYFIGGALILYFIRGARGVELIPNVDFWRSLPGLIKDGLVFLISGCRTSSIETYDRI